MSSPPIQWYPGHIAKAEQQLKRNLDKVDLVIEVRDARIPLATGHPHLNRWINGKQHLLVINRRDMVTSEARVAWEAWFKARGQRTVWCDAKAGTGVKQVQQAAIRAGDQLNERRRNRGMRPRPVRAHQADQDPAPVAPNATRGTTSSIEVILRPVDLARRAKLLHKSGPNWKFGPRMMAA